MEIDSEQVIKRQYLIHEKLLNDLQDRHTGTGRTGYCRSLSWGRGEADTESKQKARKVNKDI